ncbi:xylose isomerase-like protein [Tuber borchii]|uniref:Apurinic-apyrimidinic endonuclease 1 n=1 Tax=Tuber borchii TaxID=42251 RepID=A0A2T6ZDL7_TUBBO|nr:xylose isomerase-like protein [Tuber borchii]
MFAMMARTTRAAAEAAKRKKQKEESSSQISKREENEVEKVGEVEEVEEVEDEDLGVSVHNTQTVAAVASQVLPATTVAQSSRKREAVAEEEEETTRVVKKARGKKSEVMIPAARTAGVRMMVGAHVSMAGGVQHAITNSLKIGGNAFALFLKSQRKWTSPDMKEVDAKAFRAGCEKNGFDPRKHVLPHGSYLINLANGDAEKAKKAYDCFLDDLKRCERLGIGLYNFHPGSTLGLSRSESLSRIAKALNKAHSETKFCVTVLENMAGAGNVIGGKFEDLRDIIAMVEDKDRVGVCLDTCHLFAAGHDIRTQGSYDKVMSNFDRIIGRKYLVALHINDSKAPLASKRDLHQNIGLGFLGLEPFRLIMNDERLEGLPLILETPMEEEKTWAEEIKLLESLIGAKGDDPEFLARAKELADRGIGERRTAGIAAQKKTAKAVVKPGKGRRKSVKKDESDNEGSDNDGGEHHC